MTKNEVHVYLSSEAKKYLQARAKKEKRSMSMMAVIIIEQAKEMDKNDK